MSADEIDGILDEIDSQAPVVEEVAPTIFHRQKEVEPPKAKEPVGPSAPPSREELLARLKSKKDGFRNQRDGNKSTKINKTASYPLSPIYYCDAGNCLNIMANAEAKLCPVCKVYSYCCKECQVRDWVEHKTMCGKAATEDGLRRLDLYKQALVATDTLYNAFKDGDYTTVIHDKTNSPACMFGTVADKSNVLHWKLYLKNPLFTTTPFQDLGILASKVRAACAAFPTQKIYLISILLDRVHGDANSEAVVRLYVADQFGETMDAAAGKITKSVVKYARRQK